ncbi:MAG: hypothetical protein JXA74_08100 [Anaerolineae bacterium]|nr:hypothetical protein [Anaerolineae bacterium]
MISTEHEAQRGNEGTLPGLEAQLTAWGARQALSVERAAALRGAILSEAARLETAPSGPEVAPWPEGWWARYAAELRLVLQRSLNLDAALAACRPERLRAAVGGLAQA